jgi:hypothetical protein
MASRKLTPAQERKIERLNQIKHRASQQAAKDENKAMANLAEEAAGLALEIFLPEEGEE